MTAKDYIPPSRSLKVLAEAVQSCRGCDLYQNATQAVFGEGPAKARVMMIGEVPGDQEDLQGHPFVGPAGKLLDDSLEQAGIPRKEVYITNAVKHFKWTPRGGRRLHGKPNAREMAACRPWLEAEFEAVKPQFVVCLGASAAQSLFGRAFRITRQRGEILPTEWCEWTMATYHPSAVLRAPDRADRARMRDILTADLGKVAEALAGV